MAEKWAKSESAVATAVRKQSQANLNAYAANPALVREQFNIELAERTVAKLLKKLRFTRLSTRPYHPKKDAEAQEAFKKTSPTWSATPCSGPRPVRR